MPGSDTTTLYVRGVARSVAREAKAAAAREGRTLGSWVSEALGRAAGVAGPAVGAAEELRDDLAWYASNESRLEQQHPGEYVAIVRQTVVDHDPDFETLARRVFRRFGTRSICMPRVGRREVRVRSPRRIAS